MISTVLFATDFSAFSKEALKYALALARKTGAKVIGTHALRVSTPTYSLSNSSFAHVEELRKSALARLDTFFATQEMSGVDFETRLVEGLPEQVLNELAAEVKANLIVVGRHSRSTLERFFVGSTTERILRQAGFPVWVVPEKDHRSIRWKPILCATDFSHSSKDALHFSIELARNHNADLAVIHVVDMGVEESIAGDTLRSHLEHASRKAERDLKELVRTRGAPSGTRTLVLEGKAAAVIVEQAERMGSDLLVVGERGHMPLERLAPGSTTNALLRSSHVPIVVVPTGYAG